MRARRWFAKLVSEIKNLVPDKKQKKALSHNYDFFAVHSNIFFAKARALLRKKGFDERGVTLGNIFKRLFEAGSFLGPKELEALNSEIVEIENAQLIDALLPAGTSLKEKLGLRVAFGANEKKISNTLGRQEIGDGRFEILMKVLGERGAKIFAEKFNELHAELQIARARHNLEYNQAMEKLRQAQNN